MRPNTFKILFALMIGTALGACAPKSVESSAQRDSKEVQRKRNAVVARLLDNQWCAYIAPPAENSGFIRLTFTIDDMVKIERYQEFDGKPFGKTGDDLRGLWMVDRLLLNIRSSRDQSQTFALSAFGNKNATKTMTITDQSKPKDKTNMWACNGSIDDPIPFSIKPSDEFPDFGDLIPEEPVDEEPLEVQLEPEPEI